MFQGNQEEVKTAFGAVGFAFFVLIMYFIIFDKPNFG